ncbi:MAG: hypothetical protein JWN14_4494 [Chthonomonadales bacterium]|nr:hypothetical protein [Chthonomonadales bacterium]
MLQVKYKDFEVTADNRNDLETALDVVLKLTSSPRHFSPVESQKPVPVQGSTYTAAPIARKIESQSIIQTLSPSGLSQADLVARALQTIGRPANAQEITTYLTEDFVAKSKASVVDVVRHVLNKNERFSRFQRGVFGLSEWEEGGYPAQEKEAKLDLSTIDLSHADDYAPQSMGRE